MDRVRVSRDGKDCVDIRIDRYGRGRYEYVGEARRHRVKGIIVWSLTDWQDEWHASFAGVYGTLREAVEKMNEIVW